MRKQVLDHFYGEGSEGIAMASRLLSLSKELAELTGDRFERLEEMIDGLMLAKILYHRKLTPSCRELCLKMVGDLPTMPTND